MDGPQDPLDAFHDAFSVLTWRSPTRVKDLLRDTLRRSLAQRVMPAHPDVIESMMYVRVQGGRGDDLPFHLGHLPVLCERLREERAYVAGVYAEAQEVERLRLEASATAAAPPRPTAAYPPPAPEPQGPWPPPPGCGRALAASARLPQGPLLPGPRGGEGTPCCCPALRGSGSGG